MYAKTKASFDFDWRDGAVIGNHTWGVYMLFRDMDLLTELEIRETNFNFWVN